jgi:hypothetical protein
MMSVSTSASASVNNNPHPRDALIVFDAGPHKYTCAGEANYTSVTTWNHSHFKQFDADAIITKMMANKRTWPNSPYYGKTREEIKTGWDKNRDEAAQLGTDMHYGIECYYRGETPLTPHLGGDEGESVGKDKEGGSVGEDEGESVSDDVGKNVCANSSAVLSPYFLAFLADHPNLIPYRTEWMIFNEDVRLAGSIDMVYAGDNENEVMIYDWKRCKDIKKTNGFGDFALTDCIAHLPDTNFWHYALQLNTYKAILEAKYNKKVTRMCLVCLHPNLPSYQLLVVPDLSKELADLFALRKQQLS